MPSCPFISAACLLLWAFIFTKEKLPLFESIARLAILHKSASIDAEDLAFQGMFDCRLLITYLQSPMNVDPCGALSINSMAAVISPRVEVGNHPVTARLV